MNRTHNSELWIRKLDKKLIKQNNATDRPNGFWYSINDDWKRFCLESKNAQWVYKFNYEVDISNVNIYKITSTEGLARFGRFYGENSHNNVLINWERVAKDFDGVEIQNYNKNDWKKLYTTWAFSWDCSSGCIWNVKNVKIKKI